MSCHSGHQDECCDLTSATPGARRRSKNNTNVIPETGKCVGRMKKRRVMSFRTPARVLRPDVCDARRTKEVENNNNVIPETGKCVGTMRKRHVMSFRTPGRVLR